MFRFPRAGGKPLVLGFVFAGQSLCVGMRAGAVILPTVTTGPIAGHFMLDHLVVGGVAQADTAWILAPVRNPMRDAVRGIEWPYDAWDEAPCAAFAERMGELGVPHTFSTECGHDGQAYAGIKKGGTAPSYDGSISEATKANELLVAAGYTFRYAGIILVHGESDLGSVTYDTDLIEFQADYEADLKAITGQSQGIPMYMTQPSAGYPTALGSTTNIHQVMLDLCAAHPTTHKMVGPKYAVEYESGDYHLTPTGTRDMARLYAGQVADYRGALYVESAVRSGATITVTLATPTGTSGLTWDSSVWASNHAAQNTEWTSGKGFEVSKVSDDSHLTISSVAIVNATTVTITLSADPGVAVRVRYAATADGDILPRRGQLRTSEGHWCCHGSVDAT